MTREEREMDVWQRAYEAETTNDAYSRAWAANQALEEFRKTFPSPDMSLAAAYHMITAARQAAIEAYEAPDEESNFKGLLKVMEALGCEIPVLFVQTTPVP